MSKHYRQIANSMGMTYLFGRWGLNMGSKLPGERRLWHPRIIPLDGWITDPKEIERAMRLSGEWQVGPLKKKGSSL